MDSTTKQPHQDIEIREKPELKSVLRNITEMSITTGIWVIWSYLLLPIINLVLWVVGFKTIYMQFESAAYRELLLLLERLGLVVLVVFAVLQLWGFYNYHMFGKRNRRKEHSFDAVSELSQYFGLSPEQVADMQSKKEIVIWSLRK